jgi:hypothetical protein
LGNFVEGKRLNGQRVKGEKEEIFPPLLPLLSLLPLLPLLPLLKFPISNSKIDIILLEPINIY